MLQWLAERLMMLMKRDEAPLIASPRLDEGELLFCFIGQVSSRAGPPLIVDTHAVSFRKGGRFEIRPLKEALAEARFENLANTGRTSNLRQDLLRGFIESAVTQSLHHLRQLKDQRRAIIRPRLAEEEKRLKQWFQRWGHPHRKAAHRPAVRRKARHPPSHATGGNGKVPARPGRELEEHAPLRDG